MPFPEEIPPTYGDLTSATRDVNGGLTSTLGSLGAYRAGAHSVEVAEGAEVEIDYVCAQLATTGSEAHCGLSLLSESNWSYTGSLFTWRWTNAAGVISAQAYDRRGGGLVGPVQAGVALPIACRIHIDAAGAVRWYFGNGDDVLIHTSAAPADYVLGAAPGLCAVAGFNAGGQFTPITLKGTSLVNRAALLAAGLLQGFPAALRVIQPFVPQGTGARPRPAAGKVWPRLA